jgi:predicted MFS family arabinose efflux permease
MTVSPARPWRLWLALFGMVLPGGVLVSVSPLLNSAAMSARDLGPEQIGLIRTAEILLNACLTLWLSTRLTKVSPRPLALIGASLLVIGNLAGIPGTGFYDLLAARLIAGAGIGCMAGAAAATYAQLASPQRVAGALLPFWTMASVAAALISGQAAKHYAQLGVFGVLAAVAMLAIFIVSFTPPGRGHAAHAPAAGGLRRTTAQWFYLAAAAVLFFGSTGVWHFFARIGLSHGLASDQIGLIIAGGSLASGVVGALAFFAKDGLVRIAALTSVGVFALATISVPLAPTAAAFIAVYAVQSICYVVLTIFTPAVGVRLDRTGSTNAAASGAQTFFNAFAPATAGYLIAGLGGSYAALALICAVCGAVAFACIVMATLKLPAANPSSAP